MQHDVMENLFPPGARTRGDQLRSVLDGLFAFAGLARPDGVLVEANQAALDAAGIARDEVVGKPFWDTWWWSWSPAVQDELRRAFERARDGEAVRYDVDVRVRDDELVTIDFMLAPIQAADGRVTLLVPSGIDITERKRAERSLRESERSLREILEFLPSLVWTAHPDGSVEALSRRAGELTGLTGAPGRIENVHPDDRAAVTRAWTAAARAGTKFRAEHRLRLADGEYRWMLSRALPLRDEAGRVRRWFGTTTDIHEQKRVQERLRESRERLVAALDASRTGTFRIHLGSREIEADARLARLIGEAPVATALPLPAFLRRVHPEDRAVLDEALDRAATDGADLAVTFRLLGPDGTIRWVDGRGRAVATPGGPLSVMTGACTDVTERKWAEQVAQQNEILRTIVDSIPVMLLFYDPDGRVRMVNRAFERRIGWTNGEALEAALPIARSGDGGAPSDDAAADATGVGAGGDERWRELEPTTRGGAPLPSSWTHVSLSDGSRIGIGIDMSERRRLEAQREALLDQLRAEQARLRDRNEQLRLLTLRLSAAEQQERRRIAHTLHDHFQQLLVAAKMGAEQIRRRADRGEAGEGGDAIGDAAGRVRDLIGEVIEASRTLAVELSPPVLYDHGLAAALRWLGDHTERKHGLRVDVEADDDVEPEAEAARAFLFQAVRELLLNVVKHAAADEAQVTLARGEDGGVALTVRDRGAGCAPDAALHADGAGGFGLYSIRRRIELIGGRFRFESSPGEGCCATLSLPPGATRDGVRSEPAPIGAASSGREGAAARPSAAAARATIRLLVADDHTLLRQGLVTLMKPEPDIEVIAEASNGEEAVAAALRLRPDVVLMDVSMPRLDGVEATRRIVAALPGVRVIGLSMHDDAETNRSMLDAGAAAYVQKGGPVERIVALIRG